MVSDFATSCQNGYAAAFIFAVTTLKRLDLNFIEKLRFSSCGFNISANMPSAEVCSFCLDKPLTPTKPPATLSGRGLAPEETGMPRGVCLASYTALNSLYANHSNSLTGNSAGV